MNTNKRKTVLATMVGLFAAGGMSATMAQGQVGESARAQGVLDEIVVTAQKREQNLQDVGLAISALTGETLEAKGIDNVLDLQFSVPGLSLGPTIFGSAKASIRGVGSVNIFPGGDPGVPVHVDGHYVQSTAYLLRDFLDVERVEVLRGPQGTLYGRNAIGGNINVITKRPTEELEGLVSIDAGNYNRRLLQGVVSGPLTDNLRGRLAISDEKRDGFVENVSTLGVEDLENSDYTSVRASFDYDLAENIQISVSGYHYKDTANTVVNRVLSEFPVGSLGPFINYYDVNGAGLNVTVRDPFKISSNAPINQFDEVKGGSIDFDWSLDSLVFRSLSSYTNDHKLSSLESDGSDVVEQEEHDDVLYETFTQEFQLLSNPESETQWIVGLFYYDERSVKDTRIVFDSLFDPAGDLTLFLSNQNIDAQSLGAFGQVDYPLTDKLNLIVGLRYNEDEKTKFERGFNNAFPGGMTPEGDFVVRVDENNNWSQVSGKLGLDYHMSEDVMVYMSYSTGYKSGGFNSDSQIQSYDPEEVKAYEVGAKSQWADNRLQANVSAFYYDYTDKQELRRDEFGLILINAAEATSQGIEIELVANPMPDLSIDTTISYLKAEYDDFTSIDVANSELGLQDLSGNTLPSSPEIKFNLGIEYQWHVGSRGQLSSRIDYSWTDDQYSSFFNRERDELPSHSFTNARFNWLAADGSWEGSLYVKNLENNEVISSRFDGVRFLRFPELGQYYPPRTYGLSLTKHF